MNTTILVLIPPINHSSNQTAEPILGNIIQTVVIAESELNNKVRLQLQVIVVQADLNMDQDLII
jgi:hypothetical protein